MKEFIDIIVEAGAVAVWPLNTELSPVITRGGVPVARLVPVTPRGKRRFGALNGKIALYARLDEPLP